MDMTIDYTEVLLQNVWNKKNINVILEGNQLKPILKCVPVIRLEYTSPCIFCVVFSLVVSTSGSAMAEGPRDALVSRNSATTKHPIWKLEFQVYRMALLVCSYV